MAAVQAGDPVCLDGVLRRQRAHLLKELHSLAKAREAEPSSVVALLITAAELHIRADLGVVDAAERTLEPTPATAPHNRKTPADSTETATAEPAAS
jgi:hypothetical protein